MVHCHSAAEMLHVLCIERSHVLSSSRHVKVCDSNDGFQEDGNGAIVKYKSMRQAAAIQSAAHVAAESCWKLMEMNKGRRCSLEVEPIRGKSTQSHPLFALVMASSCPVDVSRKIAVSPDTFVVSVIEGACDELQSSKPGPGSGLALLRTFSCHGVSIFFTLQP